MRPTKLSSKVFLELPPVLAHYLEGGRNVWLESIPGKGKLSMLNRPGIFTDLEALAVERKQWVEMLGLELTRALRYRLGFEQGRREAARHYAVYAQNSRLALQAGPVFGQLQGRFVVEPVTFEFDLGAKTLYRELVLHSSAEGLSHRMAFEDGHESACWTVAGYLSGQVSEIVGRHVVTLETDCSAKGDAVCRFISRLEPEWGPEADWVREALRMEPLDGLSRAAAPQPSQVYVEDPEDGHQRYAAPAPPPAPEPVVVPEEPEAPAPPSDPMTDGIVAGSSAMQAVVKRLRQLKDSPVAILMAGEPGTGRHTLSRLVHRNSARAEAPFIVFDCSGLSPEGTSRELFGYVGGAFPGAARDYAGALLRADGGTLYLEEVTNLSQEAQGRLVRALEDGAVLPLGGTESIPVDVRIIAATQLDPLEQVGEGTLREDLFYALSVARITLPPLRERGTDVLRLAERFLQEARRRYEKPELRFSDEVKQVLRDSAWPGNVNQVRNVVEHAVVMAEGKLVRMDDLPEELLASRWGKAPQELGEQVVRAALKRTNGNKSKAAEVLGVGRTTLWRAMKRLGLE
ncbi:MAG: sigma 54-interacting transcriptional regulator [FCB group bacterium]|jgi:transcriptional regulator with AAA-type ATPase domain|nr:sigma 54-interacting transcriptional regulator [FCB group bacterium]